MVNSCRKGKQKEWEAVQLLGNLTREEWKRTGVPEKHQKTQSGDVVPIKTDSFYRQFHWEIKGANVLHTAKDLDKAIDDGHGKPALLMAWDFKNKRWIITLEAERLMKILEWLKGYESNKQ